MERKVIVGKIWEKLRYEAGSKDPKLGISFPCFFLVIIQFILFSTILLSTPNLSTGDRAEEILQAADQYRNGWPAFVVHTRITNYKKGKQKDIGLFEVMIKGDDKSLVRFLNPDQKGQYLLMRGDKMWLYMPNTRRPIRVTPLQRLMGDASNGDVARTNFSRDYTPKLLGEEIVNGKVCYKLELSATNDAATYQHVEYWVTKQESLPIKAELYLASGKHYKSITYDEYKIMNGRPALTKMTLYDRLRPDRYTIMEFLKYEPKKLPEKYFNKNYLTQLK